MGIVLQLMRKNIQSHPKKSCCPDCVTMDYFRVQLRMSWIEFSVMGIMSCTQKASMSERVSTTAFHRKPFSVLEFWAWACTCVNTCTCGGWGNIQPTDLCMCSEVVQSQESYTMSFIRTCSLVLNTRGGTPRSIERPLIFVYCIPFLMHHWCSFILLFRDSSMGM